MSLEASKKRHQSDSYNMASRRKFHRETSIQWFIVVVVFQANERILYNCTNVMYQQLHCTHLRPVKACTEVA